MSDSPIQRSLVPNKLHLDLHAGVLGLVTFQMSTFYSCCLSGAVRSTQRSRLTLSTV